VPAADFATATGRIDNRADPSNGPGTYQTSIKFGSKSGGKTIGLRRDAKI